MQHNRPLQVVGDVTPPGETPGAAPEEPPPSPRRPSPFGWVALILAFTGLALVVGHAWPLFTPRGDEVDPWRIVGSSLGVAASILAAIGWARRESARVCLLAAAVGLAAIAWEYLLIAVGVAVVLALVAIFTGAAG